MRRILGALAVATLVGAGAVGLTSGTAAAKPTRSVEFTGTSVFQLGSPECSFVHQVFDATLTTNRGDTVHIEGCVEFGSPFPFAGSFVIDSPGRRDVTGTVSGLIDASLSDPCSDDLIPVPFDFVLTPTRETGRPATPLQLDGTWCSPATPGVAGPISGTLTGALPPGTA
jgi:hypothetical protein